MVYVRLGNNRNGIEEPYKGELGTMLGLQFITDLSR